MSYDTMSGGGSLPHELQSALDKWNAGGHAGGPSVEATAQRFSLYASQADPQQLQSLTSEALGHLPAAQQQEVGRALLTLFQQNGLNPAAAGVTASHAGALSVGDTAQLLTYAQQHAPNLIQKLLGNPVVRLIILAIIAYEANKLMQGVAAGSNAPAAPAGRDLPAPSAPSGQGQSIGDHIRNTGRPAPAVGAYPDSGSRRNPSVPAWAAPTPAPDQGLIDSTREPPQRAGGHTLHHRDTNT